MGPKGHTAGAVPGRCLLVAWLPDVRWVFVRGNERREPAASYISSNQNWKSPIVFIIGWFKLGVYDMTWPVAKWFQRSKEKYWNFPKLPRPRSRTGFSLGTESSSVRQCGLWGVERWRGVYFLLWVLIFLCLGGRALKSFGSCLQWGMTCLTDCHAWAWHVRGGDGVGACPGPQHQVAIMGSHHA